MTAAQRTYTSPNGPWADGEAMKKLALLSVVSLALAAGACAQTKAKPAAKPAKKISCAVMKGDMVEIAKSTKDGKFSDYKGRRYFFCCPHCVDQFKKDPAKYAKAPSIPTPKKKK